MIKKDIDRGLEVDDKGRLWAYTKTSFVNGNNEKTEQIVKNMWKKSSIKKNKEDLMESRTRYDESLSRMDKMINTIDTPEYLEFKKQIREGNLKDFYDTFAFEYGIQRQIDAKQVKVKSVKEYLDTEKGKASEALDELKEFENQIKEAEIHFNTNGKK